MEKLPSPHVIRDGQVANLPPGFNRLVGVKVASWVGLSTLVLTPVTALITMGIAQAEHTRCQNNYQQVSYCGRSSYQQTGYRYRPTSYRNSSYYRDVSAADDGVLSLGDEGSEVSALQRRLSNLGYPVAVDGVFGTATESAVISFQSDYGLSADGIVGPETDQALRSGTANVGYQRPTSCTRPVSYCNGERPVSCSQTPYERPVSDCVRPVTYQPEPQPVRPNPEPRYVVLIPTDSGADVRDVRRVVPQAQLVREDGRGEYIRAASYRSRPPADELMKKLRQDGYDAQVRYF